MIRAPNTRLRKEHASAPNNLRRPPEDRETVNRGCYVDEEMVDLTDRPTPHNCPIPRYM
jgi:hypothetical protein